MARAEQDGEGGHDQRDIKGRVLKHRSRAEIGRHHDVRIMQEHREARRDRLQLQRNVGHDPDHRDDRHEPAEVIALAVARGDEVGDRGDAVHLADADDLADQEPAEDEGQRRAEIDGKKADARGRGAPDAPVEGPGRAVDGDRQGVDVGARDDAAALVRPAVAVIGDRKQDREINQRDRDDREPGQHGSASRPRGLAEVQRPGRDLLALGQILRRLCGRSTISAIRAISIAQARNR